MNNPLPLPQQFERWYRERYGSGSTEHGAAFAERYLTEWTQWSAGYEAGRADMREEAAQRYRVLEASFRAICESVGAHSALQVKPQPESFGRYTGNDDN